MLLDSVSLPFARSCAEKGDPNAMISDSRVRLDVVDLLGFLAAEKRAQKVDDLVIKAAVTHAIRGHPGRS